MQKNDTAFDQYFCNGAGMPATGGQSYILTPCGTPTPTPTASQVLRLLLLLLLRHGYTYSDGNCHTDSNTDGNAKLHTELHIYIGDRNDRAGNHRHRQPCDDCTTAIHFRSR